MGYHVPQFFTASLRVLNKAFINWFMPNLFILASFSSAASNNLTKGCLAQLRAWLLLKPTTWKYGRK